MNAKKQFGKGLTGFMLGLFIATVVIAGILFFLNQSNKKAFKNDIPPAKELPVPEILTPKTVEPQAFDPLPDDELLPSEEGLDIVGGEAQTSEKSEDLVPPAVVQTDKPAEQAKQEVKPQPKKPAVKQEEKKADKPVKQPEKQVKPTPEQILESGSIEKAREQAAAEAKKAEAAKKSAQSASSGGKVVVQMGSFAARSAAEERRAELALLGVAARVSEAQVNGKTTYRVQSGQLDGDAAKKVQQTLKQNGIESFSRSVK
ncbi:SPOR domain-containing protein [Neisseria weaveri]|uniref:SPOR domain-containing protein n=1 Tax=Neisseria weaveri TaxID=28091 RepID=UPI0007C9D880|nr:SPOR domain-containing protein [Neisseria weaveri]SAY50305.1 putative cell division protein FtsN [Neisseria weaveri]